VKVHVNGRETDVQAGTTVAELFKALGLADRRVAVEINRDVVARDEWPRRAVSESDTVEIVQFVGGG
jgi:thiamine biosynthesis protein ThiS